jgi:site-specific recombinase XerD
LKPNGTSTLAAALKGFLGSYLPHQRAYSLHTILSYRDSLKLLLQFAAGKRHRVSELALTDLNATTIIAFLDHIEAKRGNKAATRNVRLSAIHSFFEYVGSRAPRTSRPSSARSKPGFQTKPTPAPSNTSNPMNCARFLKLSTGRPLQAAGTTHY